MKNTAFNFEPVHVASSAGNLLNGNITSVSGPVGITLGKPRLYVKKIRVSNSDTVARTVSLYKGLTAGSAAGTEIIPVAYSIPAQSYQDFWFGGDGMILDSADFLSGVASAANVVTIGIEGEVGFLTA